MRTRTLPQLTSHFYTGCERFPLNGQLELTYRCNFDCIHCFCKGVRRKELKTREWKRIIDSLGDAGTLYLTFSGGEPFLRDDFFELYSYARRKGFLITIFTNGSLISDQTISFLSQNPPLAIEISLHSLKKDMYSKITRSPYSDSLPRLITIIGKLHRVNLNVVIKVNGMKENQDEILPIKKFTEQLLGRGKFTFDHFIFPRLDGDKKPWTQVAIEEHGLHLS